MLTAKTSSLPNQEECQEWRMPISPIDYPDRNPVLSEEERKGIEHLLSLPSGQWQAFYQQVTQLARVTKPLLDVIILFQRQRPKSYVARRHFIGHLLTYVLQTNILYWGWPSSVWETVIETIPVRTRLADGRRVRGPAGVHSPDLVLTHLAAYLFTGLHHLHEERTLPCRALGEIVFGPELVQAAFDRAKEPWLAAGYSAKG